MIGCTVKVFDNGDKYWYLNGKRHREDGPAIECANGEKVWYLNGKRHREDGPAIECADGNKYWYLKGKGLTEAQFNKAMGPSKELTVKGDCTSREVSLVEAAQVLADAMHLRQWPFYVVEMPLTELGDGPATVGFDAEKITYEVWDAVDFTTKSKHDNLPDAITAALNAIAQEKVND